MRLSWLDTIDPPIQWVRRLPQQQRHHVSGAPRIVNGQDCAVDQLCVRLAEAWFKRLGVHQLSGTIRYYRKATAIA